MTTSVPATARSLARHTRDGASGAGAQGVGLDLPPTQLLIFGNPKLGTPLVQSERSVAIDLPMKAMASEDAGGQVWLIYNDPASLAQRHGIDDRDAVVAKMTGALATFSDAATGSSASK